MKKLLLITWMIFFCCIPMLNAQHQPDESKRLRDSVFQVYNAMPSDSLRPKYLRNLFQRYIGQEWSIELLDSALSISIQQGWQTIELATRFDYLRHFQFLGKVDEYEASLQQLKKASYRYQMYESYFRGWEGLLRSKVSKGDTEYAMLEARKMHDEAIRLNMKTGVFLSYIALANAQNGAKLFQEAILTYKKAMALPEIDNSGKIILHEALSRTYLNVHDYKRSLLELKAQHAILQHLIEKSPNGLFNYGPRMLANILNSCKVYAKLYDAKELKKGLEEARKYYNEDCYYSSYMTYHTMWGEYYSLIHDWKNSIAAYDLAMSRFNGAQVTYENGIRRKKAKVVIASGDYKYGAEIYREAASINDSINKDILRLHKEALQANYRIKKAILDKERHERRYRQVMLGGSFLLLMLAVLAVIRLYCIRGSLKKSEEEIRSAYRTVETANKMKEVFLRNIIKEIRIPLGTAVSLSDLLCKRDDLSGEQALLYSSTIKAEAGKLMNLILNVLDLSRLESGMMKYSLQEYDAVQLCMEAQQRIEVYGDKQIVLTFETMAEVLPVRVDYGRFIKLLTSVLSFPTGKTDVLSVAYSLKEEKDHLVITVHNSPLLQPDVDKQMSQIQHDINSLFLNNFGGSYELSEVDGERIIVITYPLKK